MSPVQQDNLGDLIPSSTPDEPIGALVVEPDGVLVAGDPEFVASYVERLKSLASDAVSVADVSTQNVADVAAAAGAVAALAAGAGEFVRIAPHSMELIQNHNLVPGVPGFFLPTVVDGAHKFAGQIQWSPVTMLPAQALALQMAMVTISLRTAIASVESAVERVQDTVDAILTLAKADQAGNVLGAHAALSKLAAFVDESGRLSSADWDSVAGLGPALEITAAKLRHFVRLTLDSFDPTASAKERAAFLDKTVNQSLLGATLQLLVVTEDSLYKWHTLKAARIEATEPQHLDTSYRMMKDLLGDHLREDAELLTQARDILHACTEIKPLEIARWKSAASIRENAATLRQGLDDFAEARRTKVLEWDEHSHPGFRDAIDELGNRAKVVGAAIGDGATFIGGKALDAGAAGFGRVGAGLMRVAESRDKSSAPETVLVDQPGQRD
ncbi:hypothetical protein [Rhodococcus triatomae]|nr:hypothetical protein G419_05532 [Rhodococcus triatomae BKS 15-14]